MVLRDVAPSCRGQFAVNYDKNEERRLWDIRRILVIEKVAQTFWRSLFIHALCARHICLNHACMHIRVYSLLLRSFYKTFP